MADIIGELGIDTTDFQQQMDAAMSKATALGMEALSVTGKLAGMAIVAGGILAKGIYESNQRAKELEETLSEIEKSDPINSKLVGLSEFQNRLKTIRSELKEMDDVKIADRIYDFIGSARLLGGEGFDAKQAEQEEQRNRLLKEQDDALRGIADKERDQLEILRLRLAGDEQGAEILKVQLSYKEKIGQATREGNADLAVTLKQEMQVSEELIKQKGYKEQAAREMKAEAEERDKRFKAEAAAFEKANKAEVASFKKEQKEYDDAKKAGADTDRNMANEAVEFSNKQKEAAEKVAKAEAKRREENERITNELKRQNEVVDLQRKGNETMAKDARIRNEYEEKIREAIRDGNAEGEAELKKLRDKELDDVSVEESKKSPRQRANERKAGRRGESDREKAWGQERDLDDRLARGAKGDKNSRLEQRREQNKRVAEGRDREDVARKHPDSKREGFTTTDSQNLQKIAAALAVRS